MNTKYKTTIKVLKEELLISENKLDNFIGEELEKKIKLLKYKEVIKIFRMRIKSLKTVLKYLGE